jgi:hypothetical protein
MRDLQTLLGPSIHGSDVAWRDMRIVNEAPAARMSLEEKLEPAVAF